MSYSQKLKNVATKMLNSIRTLNLFPASPPSIDEHQLKTEKISTFVYIILLITGCLVLLVYTAIQTVTQTITIQEPSFSQYHTLYDEHQEKLSCPCSTIANQYEDFIWIDPIFHPVCGRRNFFLQEWIKYNYSLSATIALPRLSSAPLSDIPVSGIVLLTGRQYHFEFVGCLQFDATDLDRITFGEFISWKNTAACSGIYSIDDENIFLWSWFYSYNYSSQLYHV